MDDASERTPSPVAPIRSLPPFTDPIIQRPTFSSHLSYWIFVLFGIVHGFFHFHDNLGIEKRPTVSNGSIIWIEVFVGIAPKTSFEIISCPSLLIVQQFLHPISPYICARYSGHFVNSMWINNSNYYYWWISIFNAFNIYKCDVCSVSDIGLASLTLHNSDKTPWSVLIVNALGIIQIRQKQEYFISDLSMLGPGPNKAAMFRREMTENHKIERTTETAVDKTRHSPSSRNNYDVSFIVTVALFWMLGRHLSDAKRIEYDYDQ